MDKRLFFLFVFLLSQFVLVAAPSRGVPSGCDPKVMSEAYWKVWNEFEQCKIDADIEANRKADGGSPSRSARSKYSLSVVARGLLPPAPLMRMSQGPKSASTA